MMKYGGFKQAIIFLAMVPLIVGGSVHEVRGQEPPAALVVSLPDITAPYNGSLDIPVHITDTIGREIVSVEVFVTYDGDLLIPQATPVTATSMTADWAIEHNIVDGNGTPINTIKIAMADEVALFGAGDLVTLHFTVADQRAPTTSLLGLEHVLLNDGSPENTPSDGSVTLVGFSGTIAVDKNEILPGETVTVTVSDVDENRNGQQEDTFDATVMVRDGSGTIVEMEVLPMRETDISTGLFTGALQTEFSLTPHSGDGIVQTRAGDAVEFLYDDLLDGSGDMATQTVTVDVTGGTDGTIEVSVVTQPGDIVRIKVVDADLNTSGGQETVSVSAVNSRTNESVEVELTEIGADDDAFFGTLTTTSGASTADAMGTIETDIITVTYNDAVTALGENVDLTGQNQVVDPLGDVDDNGNVQAYDAALVLQHVLTALLTGLDALSADVGEPFAQITPFDASLILQKVVGKITGFPVQDGSSLNHPQPTPSSFPKWVVEERSLTLRVEEGYLSLWMQDRAGILSGDLLIEGIDGRVAMAEELGDFLSASRSGEKGLQVVFAGADPVHGPGELLRIYSAVGPDNVQLTRAAFNDGSIVARPGKMALEGTPLGYALHGNVPNPFNPETSISFELPAESQVQLEIFDVVGQQVRTLVADALSAGPHQVRWNGRDDAGATVSSGIYFYRLQARGAAGDFTLRRRMLLLK